MNIYAFNRGLISRLALARGDLERYALSAETQTNWMPRTLGSMMLRPGTEYIGEVIATPRFLPFIYSTTDTALIEFTDEAMRVWVDDEVISRPAVTSAVTNGLFTSDVASWTDADDAGASSVWEAGALAMTGTGVGEAIRTQTVTLVETGVEHALRVVVGRGPVLLRVGSVSGGDEYITETSLDTGTHSLSFTPTTNMYIRVSNRLKRKVLLNSITIESSGDMNLPTIWTETDLPNVRFDASADVTFVSCEGLALQKIERRAERSWSVTEYFPENGPFLVENVRQINITPSAITGEITLTASAKIFKPGNVGSLYRLASTGQLVSEAITAENQFSDEIRVTGVDSTRQFRIVVSGTFVATVTLQRSVSEPGSWVDVTTYAAPTTVAAYDDTLDNQVIYYRIGVKAGAFTSGTADVSLEYAGGSINGIVKVTAYSTELSVSATVLKSLGGTTATDIWSEGAWSDRRGYPTALALYEGRLWAAGKDKVWSSITDAFFSYDDEEEGDAGPISRSIGSGPVDTANWILPLQRLLIGTDGTELSAKSSSFDEPLTPTNFNIKTASSQGSAKIEAVEVDSQGFYVQRSGIRVYQLMYDADLIDYASVDITSLVPEVCEPGVKRIVVQRQPDTRVHVVRTDGKVAVLISDRAEDVKCWILVETDGLVVDAVVLPGTTEDKLYYVVYRNGAYLLERWALESECRGGQTSKCIDSHVVSSGRTITGLDHLENLTVCAWADGADIGTFTVSSGTVDVGASYSSVVIGLPYEARFKTAKLITTLEPNKYKRVSSIGLILADTHKAGLQYGPDFDSLFDLPNVEGSITDPDYVWESYDQDMFAFEGTWNTDSRVCLYAESPRPATVCGLTIDLD